MNLRKIAGMLLLLAAVPLAACHSSQLNVTVENRTGNTIRLLEVDYPNASFGSDTMSGGAVINTHIQITGKGPISVQYTSGEGHSVQNKGPQVADHEEGNLDILLLPGGKAEFHPAPVK